MIPDEFGLVKTEKQKFYAFTIHLIVSHLFQPIILQYISLTAFIIRYHGELDDAGPEK